MLKLPALALVFFAGLLAACSDEGRSVEEALAAGSSPTPATMSVPAASEEPDPPEVAIGERLFTETRFAQYFAAHAKGVNKPLAKGDPVMDRQKNALGPDFAGPFAGQSMNCRACHLVDEHLNVAGAGMRSYADFARRPPIPDRGDGKTTSPRNAPVMVNAALKRPEGFLLHFDGEFPSMAVLVQAAFTGRNFGWQPTERAQALAHVAKVIREDDGTGELAQAFGGAYRDVLAGKDSVPAPFRLPPAYRIDVATASDQQIMDALAKLVAAYSDSLEFMRDADGRYTGSPFDAFLAKNALPALPKTGEVDLLYARRLRAALAEKQDWQWVSASEGAFKFHTQAFVFGELELKGLQIFLREPASVTPSAPELAQGGIGNCLACHAPPHFTDFKLHNTGASQKEYDGVHGAGAFGKLVVPNLAQRQATPAAYLPASGAHPDYQELFRAPVDKRYPERADLGAWSVVLNPDFPATQDALKQLICSFCDDEALLSASLARFKTPGLRDLGHSAPYLHSGQLDTLEQVADFYLEMSALARANKLRNAPPEFARMALTPADREALAAFLRALNEDYE